MQIEYLNESAFVNDPMYGISWTGEGYQIRLGNPRRDFYFTEFFPLSRHPDALRVAQQVRDKVVRSKAFRNRKMGTRGAANTTGFFGVSCDCHWTTRERNGRIDTCRKFRFYIRTNEIASNGKLAYRCMSGILKGPWLTYRQAVKLRHEIFGKRLTDKLIEQRYDEVFLPNYQKRLEDLELDWRRV